MCDQHLHRFKAFNGYRLDGTKLPRRSLVQMSLEMGVSCELMQVSIMGLSTICCRFQSRLQCTHTSGAVINDNSEEIAWCTGG
jgi:hypothetical protein